METPRQRLDRIADRLPGALDFSGVQRRRVHLSETAASLRPATLRQLVEGRRNRLQNLSSRLSLRPIQREMAAQKDALGRLAQRLDAAQAARIDRQRQALTATGRQLEILSYKATLERGYAVVRSGDEILTTRAAAAKADALQIEFADGTLDLEGGAAQAPKKEAPKPPAEGGGQGSLF